MQLLYVDSTYCSIFPISRVRPSINGWTLERLRAREKAEKRSGGYGTAEFVGLQVEGTPTADPKKKSKMKEKEKSEDDGLEKRYTILVLF